MDDLKKLKDKYYKISKEQKENAWYIKDDKRKYNLRLKEKENYEKWKLLDGIIRAKEKGEKKDV